MILDWVAGIFELSGGWLIGSKNKIGFILNLLGCLLWIYVAFSSKVYGLLIVVIPAIFVNIRNFIKWGKDK